MNTEERALQYAYELGEAKGIIGMLLAALDHTDGDALRIARQLAVDWIEKNAPRTVPLVRLGTVGPRRSAAGAGPTTIACHIAASSDAMVGSAAGTPGPTLLADGPGESAGMSAAGHPDGTAGPESAPGPADDLPGPASTPRPAGPGRLERLCQGLDLTALRCDGATLFLPDGSQLMVRAPVGQVVVHWVPATTGQWRTVRMNRDHAGDPGEINGAVIDLLPELDG